MTGALPSPETIRQMDRKTLKPLLKEAGIKINAELAENLIQVLYPSSTSSFAHLKPPSTCSFKNNTTESDYESDLSFHDASSKHVTSSPEVGRKPLKGILKKPKLPVSMPADPFQIASSTSSIPKPTEILKKEDQSLVSSISDVNEKKPGGVYTFMRSLLKTSKVTPPRPLYPSLEDEGISSNDAPQYNEPIQRPKTLLSFAVQTESVRTKHQIQQTDTDWGALMNPSLLTKQEEPIVITEPKKVVQEEPILNDLEHVPEVTSSVKFLVKNLPDVEKFCTVHGGKRTCRADSWARMEIRRGVRFIVHGTILDRVMFSVDDLFRNFKVDPSDYGDVCRDCVIENRKRLNAGMPQETAAETKPALESTPTKPSQKVLAPPKTITPQRLRKSQSHHAMSVPVQKAQRHEKENVPSPNTKPVNPHYASPLKKHTPFQKQQPQSPIAITHSPVAHVSRKVIHSPVVKKHQQSPRKPLTVGSPRKLASPVVQKMRSLSLHSSQPPPVLPFDDVTSRVDESDFFRPRKTLLRTPPK